MTYSRNRAVVLAIVNGGMSVKDAADHFDISSRWIRTLLQRFRTGGLEALEPRSKRPLTNPNQTPAEVRETIVKLRRQLVRDKLDAGAESIYDESSSSSTAPKESPSTKQQERTTPSTPSTQPRTTSRKRKRPTQSGTMTCDTGPETRNDDARHQRQNKKKSRDIE
ncbi:helix-turn-helix domain-containing protein [Brevibacterium luteolum]|uniref:helix-turn-helix domain-containing protein n=1 Tax=Brevibacterium luteolum TaxID=199591 RepID=UPI003878F84F